MADRHGIRVQISATPGSEKINVRRLVGRTTVTAKHLPTDVVGQDE
jgi:hypothetical protein